MVGAHFWEWFSLILLVKIVSWCKNFIIKRSGSYRDFLITHFSEIPLLFVYNPITFAVNNPENSFLFQL